MSERQQVRDLRSREVGIQVAAVYLGSHLS